MSAELQAIRLIGGVLPAALLTRIQTGTVTDKASLSSSSYFLAGQEQPRDAAVRAWSYLRGAWQTWREADAASDQHAPGTGLARDKWLLILLNELGYGRVSTSAAERIDTTEYPISHRWNNVPIHLLGPRVDLDRRNKGILGAARAPQSMLQEFLNRSEGDLWGLLSNGVHLRLLRDSTALAGSAYVEFDLESIFDGDLYAEFLLLWHLVHVSRLAKRRQREDGPEDCWLEAWRSESISAGARALEHLRAGVEGAITALGTGFLAHRDNGWLRHALYSGEISDRDLHRQLLRLIYRLLFVFVSEDRGALLDPAGTTTAQTRYREYFSTSRLRALTRSVAGGQHPDLWRAQRMILAALGHEGLPAVAIPALGGLFDPDDRAPSVTSVPKVAGVPGRDLLLSADLSNEHFLLAIRHLSWIKPLNERVQAVDYRHLGAEELGGVYESLLELTPRVDLTARQFALEQVLGNERKTSGSYYTPPALVSALLDSALDPVLDDALNQGTTAEEKEVNLLALTVCDPASGSGGFLVAAARRIARRLAQVRSGEDEPTPSEVQHALHDVVARCIYGVDMNDLAAELAKVSLWLEALEPGKPLGFLDARIRVGNSLFGTTPALLAAGVPDEAFKEVEGDDKAIATVIRKRNRAESRGQRELSWANASELVTEYRQLREVVLEPTDDVDRARETVRLWDEYLASPERVALKLQADSWAAAFVWPLHESTVSPPTTGLVREFGNPDGGRYYSETVKEVERLVKKYRFFHWHVEFPEVFHDAEDVRRLGSQTNGNGFSCMLGNPPWEQVEVDEKEFFNGLNDSIAEETNATRRGALIDELATTDRPLYDRFKAVKLDAERLSKFARNSGAYSRSSGGRVNLYRLFSELFTRLAGKEGRAGFIAPTGVVTDATSAPLVNWWVSEQRLERVDDFINRNRIFEGVKPPVRFSAIVLSRAGSTDEVDTATMLDEAGKALYPALRIRVPYALMQAMNPENGLLPLFANQIDAQLAAAAYLGSISLEIFGINTRQGAINLTTSAHELIRLTEVSADKRATLIPVLESKLTDFYDSAAATFANVEPTRLYQKKAGPKRSEQGERAALPVTRYFVDKTKAEKRWPSARRWVLAGKEMTDAKTSARASVFCAVPFCCPSGSLQLIYNDDSSVAELLYLLGVLNSIPFDFFARQKMSGSHLTAVILRQLPIPGYADAAPHLRATIVANALALSTACTPLVEEAKAKGLAVRAVEDRDRARSDIDASVARLFNFTREDFEQVLDSFPVLKRMELAKYGEFTTRTAALRSFDEQCLRAGHETTTPQSLAATATPGDVESDRMLVSDRTHEMRNNGA